MSRVATVPTQRVMAAAVLNAQEKLSISQAQLSTGKKATNFAALGTETVRNLSAHSMLARQDAHSIVAKRLNTTLSLYQGSIEAVQTATDDLRKQILTAFGTGNSAGLQEAIESGFDQFRTSLNASEGGIPLFAGSQTEASPFSVDSFAQVATTPAANAFHDDTVRASARVADNVDVKYGIGASDVGTGIYEAFRTLAQAGTIGDHPTDAQKLTLQQAIAQLDTGLAQLRGVNAENGRRQGQVEDMMARGDERSLLLKGVIQDNEDADLGQVAVDIAQQKTVLEASYSVVAQLSKLSIVNYLG